jgi:hypothetical protein
MKCLSLVVLTILWCGTSSLCLADADTSPTSYGGIHVQRSFVTKNDPSGGTLSYSTSPNAAAAYNSDMAVYFQSPKPDYSIDKDNSPIGVVGFFAAAEEHINSDSDTNISQHSLAAEVGLDDRATWIFEDKNPPPVAHGEPYRYHQFLLYTTLGLQFQSTQRGDLHKLLASVRFLPTAQDLAMGGDYLSFPDFRYLGDSGTHHLKFGWAPTLGVDLGGTTHDTVPIVKPKPGSKPASPPLETREPVCRLVAGVHPTLGFDYLKLLTNNTIEDSSLYLDDTFYVLVPESRAVNIFSSGLNIGFNKTASLDFYYKIGRDAPTFRKVESFNIGLSFKF